MAEPCTFGNVYADTVAQSFAKAVAKARGICLGLGFGIEPQGLSEHREPLLSVERAENLNRLGHAGSPLNVRTVRAALHEVPVVRSGLAPVPFTSHGGPLS